MLLISAAYAVFESDNVALVCERRLFNQAAKEQPSLRSGQSSEGVVIGLGASVRNDVENGEEKDASSNVPRNMDEMEWPFKKDKTRHNTTETS